MRNIGKEEGNSNSHLVNNNKQSIVTKQNNKIQKQENLT